MPKAVLALSSLTINGDHKAMVITNDGKKFLELAIRNSHAIKYFSLVYLISSEVKI